MYAQVDCLQLVVMLLTQHDLAAPPILVQSLSLRRMALRYQITCLIPGDTLTKRPGVAVSISGKW